MRSSFLHLRPKVEFVLVITGLLLASSCASRHDAANPVAGFRGVQIERGETQRAGQSEEEISRNKSDSETVANTLADRLKRENLFRHVDIVKVADPIRRKDRYTHTIRFSIHKFHLRADDNIAHRAGRAALRSRGTRGYFIDKGIPRKWDAEVEIEFELRVARSGEEILAKTYSATPRSVRVRGFSDGKEQRQLISDALEEVVRRFVADAARIAR